MPKLCATAEGHADVCGPCHHIRPCGCPYSLLLPKSVLMSKDHNAKDWDGGNGAHGLCSS